MWWSLRWWWATDGTVDESATAAIALKEGSKVEVGDRLTIGRWNVVVIAG